MTDPAPHSLAAIQKCAELPVGKIWAHKEVRSWPDKCYSAEGEDDRSVVPTARRYMVLKMENQLKRRFKELAEQAERLEASKRMEYDKYLSRNEERIDSNALLNWKVKAKALLVNACGETSQHFKHFEGSESSPYSTNLSNFRRMRAVFEAAQEDYEGGYLASVHDLVRADLFGSELEQASELLKSRYPVAAAVIAGVVLETAIRELCARNQIPFAKLDKMNADLAKAGVYNGIVQKRVTHLAAVRNSAAHGNESEFKSYDVKAMIEQVEQFLATHLS